MAGWLCRNLKNLGTDCATNPSDVSFCPNNSSTQGQIFYVNITSANPPPVYNVYSVDGCFGPEGAPQGTVAAILVTQNGQKVPMDGGSAIEQDMAGGSTLAAQCFHGKHAQ